MDCSGGGEASPSPGGGDDCDSDRVGGGEAGGGEAEPEAGGGDAGGGEPGGGEAAGGGEAGGGDAGGGEAGGGEAAGVVELLPPPPLLLLSAGGGVTFFSGDSVFSAGAGGAFASSFLSPNPDDALFATGGPGVSAEFAIILLIFVTILLPLYCSLLFICPLLLLLFPLLKLNFLPPLCNSITINCISSVNSITPQFSQLETQNANR